MGIEVCEAQFLELQLQHVHAQPVGDGGVDFQGFAGDSAARVDRHGGNSAHVVQPVGQLDEDDPEVAAHGQKKFAETLRVGLLAGAEFHLVDLGHAVDQARDLLAEFARQPLDRDVGVFNGVMEDRSGDGLVIHAHPGQDGGNRHRVQDVVFAGTPGLAAVGFFTHFEGVQGFGDLLGFKVGVEQATQFANGTRITHMTERLYTWNR